MTQLHRYKLKKDCFVDIEVDTDEARKGTGAVSTSLSTRIKETQTELSDLLKTVPIIASDIKQSLESIIDHTDELSIEFGFKIGADMGIIIAKSNAEAHFKVNIKWKA